ncbi:Cdk-related kinase 1 [Rhodotorula toruloides ATCC 204091]|uniref:Cdk-related kinase 1 n=1 Tax=Rhodotorula toruloides TaxID=5286 RepID=A0A0K3CJW7_RHOTO|nr:Cdk-related kinase 1 [Rhodotorula toruloides ATCC 204091]PRQ72847.1 Cdk-related kinase 1 [Rhodotorula toruloides]
MSPALAHPLPNALTHHHHRDLIGSPPTNPPASLGGFLGRVALYGASSAKAIGQAGAAGRAAGADLASSSSSPSPSAAAAPPPFVATTAAQVASGVTVPAMHASTSPPRAGPSSHPPAYLSAGQPYTREFPPPLAPRHWTVLKEVGDGSFGTVWLADWHSPLNLPPGTQPPGPSSRPEYKGKQLVAIKRMKKAFEGGWDECLKLKELKSLRQIPMHPNIIPLYDAFLLPSTRELYFVFECMEGNLYQLTKSRKGRPLASGLTASIFYQILCGLQHIHAHGYFHRDLKPENLLITTTGLADYPCSSLFALPGAPPEKDVIVVVKLADFGLAREIASKPPYTEYVSTRWYRAPEVLLRSRDYSVPVDMWALGTILVEVLTLKPIFPGDSEVDQVYKICEVLGDPSSEYGVDERGRIRGGGGWTRGVKMAKDVGFAFPKVPPRNFASLFDPNTVPVQLIDCIADLLRYEPKARLTAQQCLDHAYFRDVAYRFAPQPAPPPVPVPVQQLPTPAPSHGSTTSYSSTHGGSSSLSVSTTGLSTKAGSSLASPRDLPPSHTYSHGSAPSFKLPYPSDPNAQALPSPDHFSASHRSHRNFSISSGASSGGGLSNYPIQVGQGGATSPAGLPTDQQSVLSMPSPAIAGSVWSGQEGTYGASGAGQGGLRPVVPAGLARRGSIAPSIAPSTYYDGSIFEGMAPSRASSIMSFPIGYSGGGGGAEPSSSSAFQQSRVDGSSLNGLGVNSYRPSSPTSSIYSQPNYPSQPPRHTGPIQFGTTSLNPLKRSPSNASMSNASMSSASHGTASGVPPPAAPAANAGPIDPKKAKKEAERVAREQEKAARIAKEQAARDRARAVLKKKTQLKEAADPLHNFAQGKNGPGQGTLASSAASISSGASFVDKGKGRALPSDWMVQQRMPQIIEHTSKLAVSGPGFDPYATGQAGAGAGGGAGTGPSGFAASFASMRKARKRNDDDDVHSISSNETGHSAQWPFPYASRGRTFSISSKATSASDPERRHQRDLLEVGDPLARVSSISSLPGPSGSAMARPGGVGSGAMHRFPSYGHYTAPSTGHSSLDANFIAAMQGHGMSSATDLPSWQPTAARSTDVLSQHRPESRSRLASPSDTRYSPYMVPPSHSQHAPRSPGPTLPPIQSFDAPPQTQHPILQRQATSGGASISSFRSTPAAMPSYFSSFGSAAQNGGSGGEANGVSPNVGVYQLPYLPSMDTEPSPPAANDGAAGQGSMLSPMSTTFPYSTSDPSPPPQPQGPPIPHHIAPG